MQQIEDDVLPVAFAETAAQVPMLIVFTFAVRAQAQRLIFDFLLLFPGQEEALAGQFCDLMDEADAVVDVVAIKQAYILIRNQHLLVADLALLNLLGLVGVELVLKQWH